MTIVLTEDDQIGDFGVNTTAEEELALVTALAAERFDQLRGILPANAEADSPKP